MGVVVWRGRYHILMLTRACASATDAESLAKTILFGFVREIVHLCPGDVHSNNISTGIIVAVFVHTYRSRHEVSLGAAADDRRIETSFSGQRKLWNWTCLVKGT